MVSERHEPLVALQSLELHVRGTVRAEGQRLERRLPLLVDAAVGFLGGVELIDDVDRLRRHAELRHERVERDHLRALHAGLRDEVVELHAEHHLALRAQFRRELGGHRAEVLIFVERLAEKLAQLGIDGLRIIVAQEAERRVDLLLEHLAVRLGKRREHLDEQRQQVRAFRGRQPLAQQPPARLFRALLEPRKKRARGNAFADFGGEAVGENAHSWIPRPARRIKWCRANYAALRGLSMAGSVQEPVLNLNRNRNPARSAERKPGWSGLGLGLRLRLRSSRASSSFHRTSAVDQCADVPTFPDLRRPSWLPPLFARAKLVRAY